MCQSTRHHCLLAMSESISALNPYKHNNQLEMHTSKPTDCCCAIQANCDIDSSIPLLAETGPLAIPLQCLIKRALVSVQPQVRL